jgi:hypothetical protein
MGERNGLNSQVQAIATSRVAVGALLVLAPGPTARLWLGRKVSDPLSRLFARSVGGRDIALGVGAILALRHGASVRGWLEAMALADASDAAAVLLGARHLSPGRVVLALIPSVSAVGFSRWLVDQLGEPGDVPPHRPAESPPPF